jgi:NADH:ubiquinone oxidoreductase subunit F (NADH-binding)/NADH:ubiquinone oxidoreductase subunit E
VPGEVNAAFAAIGGAVTSFAASEQIPALPVDPRAAVCYTVLLWPTTARYRDPGDFRGAGSADLIFEELKAIQREHGYISAGELAALAGRIHVPVSRLHGVASFYPHFHLTPPARAEVKVCGDMSCHLRGACELKSSLERRFAGGSPQDISIRDASCLGRCDAAPALSINDRIYSGVSDTEADALVRVALAGAELPETPRAARRSDCASDPYPGAEKYGCLRTLARTRDWDAALATLKASNLRGMGGAGFPTEMKWSLVRRAPGAEKYVVCNADESEPGTIKDRFLLTNLPYLVIEGMILAGLITGARKGILYLRHEYEEQEHILSDELMRCRKQGLIGRGVLGTDLDFHLELFISPGGYICGEESALLEAIEGKRAEPRNKPPFPVDQGLWGMPTVINNVETFANVPQILARGVEWYKSAGTGGPNGAAGLKFVGVSGRVERPGVFEVPMGTPISELIFKYAGGVLGGRTLKAFAPSGPSSGYLPASMADVPLDFKSLAATGSMMGSGAIVVCDDRTCMLDMALNSVRFFRNESCGKCVPCRVGSQKMTDILTRWTDGGAPKSDWSADLELVRQLSEAMRLTSICGLGQIVPAPIESVLKHFREEVEAHLTRRECPAGVCFSSAAKPTAASAQRARTA